MLRRTLIVGAGSIGTRHMKNLRELAVTSLAVVDIDAARRKELDREGVPAFASLEQGLAWQPQAVFIATPTQFHIEQAIEAAKAGCDLFIEKPLSHSLARCTELVELAEKNALITLVGCNMRFHLGPFRIKGLLEDQAIGRVLAARLQCGSYLPAWRPHQDYRTSYSASP